MVAIVPNEGIAVNKEPLIVWLVVAGAAPRSTIQKHAGCRMCAYVFVGALALNGLERILVDAVSGEWHDVAMSTASALNACGARTSRDDTVAGVLIDFVRTVTTRSLLAFEKDRFALAQAATLDHVA